MAVQGEGKTKLAVTVFSDYICPFCYVGFVRLMKLRAQFDLKVDWRSFEIHPNTSSEGMPISELGYSQTRWELMMENLKELARLEELNIAERTFTTNSHMALLLSEACKEEKEEIFYSLHAGLFESFFVEKRNIGDIEVLRTLARKVGVSTYNIERAWTDPRLEDALRKDAETARQCGIRAVPTFIIGKRTIVGAVPTAVLAHAATEVLENTSN